MNTAFVDETKNNVCSFLDPVTAMSTLFLPKELAGDMDENLSGQIKDITLVLYSSAVSSPYQDQKADTNNALTTLLGEYHTMTIEKSSSALSIRDINSERQGHQRGEGVGQTNFQRDVRSTNSRSEFTLEQTQLQVQTKLPSPTTVIPRGLRDVDDPTISVVAWNDCTEVILDGILDIGFCSHDIENGLSITTWISDMEARTNITTNDAMWFRTELFDDSMSFGGVEIYKQNNDRNLFTANVDIRYPDNHDMDWFVMNASISERNIGEGLIISTSIYEDEGILDISTGDGLVITGTVATPDVQYVSLGLSLFANDESSAHGYIDISSRKEDSDSLFKMHGGVHEIDDGLQLQFAVNDKNGIANFTGGVDVVHVRLTDDGDEVMHMQLRVNDTSTILELALSDPASVAMGDLFLLRLDLGWTIDELVNGVNVLRLHEFSISTNNEETVWLTFRGILDIKESNETHRFDIGLPELDVIAEITELTFRLSGEEAALFGKSIQVRDSNPLRADIELPEVGYDFIERLIEKFLWKWFLYDPNIDISNIEPNVFASFSNSTDNSLQAWVKLSITQGSGGDLDYLYAAVDVDFDITDALNWDILLEQAYVVLNEQNDTIAVSNTHLILEGSEITDVAFQMPTMNVSLLGKVWHGTAHATVSQTNIQVGIGIQDEKFLKDVVSFDFNVDMDLEDILVWHINVTEVDFVFAGVQVIYFAFDTSVNATDFFDLEWFAHKMTLTMFNKVWVKESQMYAVVYVSDDNLDIGFKWTEALTNVIDTGAIIAWYDFDKDGDGDVETQVVEFSRLEAVFGNFVLARGTMNVTISIQDLFDMFVEVSDMSLTLFNHQVGMDVHIDGHIHSLEEVGSEGVDMALVVTEEMRPKYFMGILMAWDIASIFDLSLEITRAGVVFGDDTYVLADFAMNVTITEVNEGVQIDITDLDLSLFNFDLAVDATGSLGITTADGAVDVWVLITDAKKKGAVAIPTKLFDARFTATARFNETRYEHPVDYIWFPPVTKRFARQITAAHIIAKQVDSNEYYVLLHSPHTLSFEYTFLWFIPESVIFRVDAWELTLFDHVVSTELEGYALANLDYELGLGMGLVDGVTTVFDMGIALNITHWDTLTEWQVEVSKLGVIINDDPWVSFVGVIAVKDDLPHDLFVSTDVELIKFPFDTHMYDDLTVHLALNVSDVHFMLDVDVYDNTTLGILKEMFVLNVFTTMSLEALDNFTITFDQLSFDWSGKQPHEMDMSGTRMQMKQDL